MGGPEPDFVVVGEKVALGPLRPELAADPVPEDHGESVLR